MSFADFHQRNNNASVARNSNMSSSSSSSSSPLSSSSYRQQTNNEISESIQQFQKKCTLLREKLVELKRQSISSTTKSDLESQLTDTKQIEIQIKSQLDNQLKELDTNTNNNSTANSQNQQSRNNNSNNNSSSSSSSNNNNTSVEEAQKRAMLLKLMKDYERVRAIFMTIVNESSQLRISSKNINSSANNNKTKANSSNTSAPFSRYDTSHKRDTNTNNNDDTIFSRFANNENTNDNTNNNNTQNNMSSNDQSYDRHNNYDNSGNNKSNSNSNSSSYNIKGMGIKNRNNNNSSSTSNNSNSSSYHQQQMLEFKLMPSLQGQEVEDAIREERERDIRRMNQDLILVNEMMRDMANIVQSQGAMVEEVATSVESSHEQATAGLIQLQQAADNQSSCVLS